jgi:flagellar basal-body rod modification protein FlgD
MNVDPATSTTPAASTTTGTQAQAAATAASASLSTDFNSFLTLLTAQLQHQDPLQPMDSSQFTTQLVQITGVQQTVATNQNLAQLLSLTQAGQSAALVNYIGKTITANGNTTSLSHGQANWQYQLPSDAQSVKLTITDQNGKQVGTQTGETGKGAHTFTWDGTIASGLKAPDGIYTLSVTAKDSFGSSIQATTQVSGQVGGIETDAGQQFLVVGSSKVRLSDVLSVNPGSSAAAASNLASSALNSLTGN